MKKIMLGIILMSLVVTSATAQEANKVAPAKPSSLLFLGNTAYLLSLNSKKILIDAPYYGGADWGLIMPSRETLEKIEKAQPPFDKLDLVLISHNHVDHYTAGPLITCLSNNPGAALIAPANVLEALKNTAGKEAEIKNKLIDPAVERGKRVRMEVNGVTVEVIGGSHHYPDRQGYIHYAYLISGGGKTVFHSAAWVADHAAEIDPSLWQLKTPIDIALLHYFSFEANWVAGNDVAEKIKQRRQFVKDVLRPGKIVLHHLYDYRQTLPAMRQLAQELKSDFPVILIPGKSLEEIGL